MYGRIKALLPRTDISYFYEREINKTFNWIKNMQNVDGSFSAFDKDKTG